MINFRSANKYCCEDIRLIENYENAVNDPEIWDCHHRLEIELNLSSQELKDRNLYYGRPAYELIFLTHSEHISLHTSGEKHPMYGKRGKYSPMFGKNSEDYMSEEAIKEKRKKQSENIKGKNKDRRWMNNGITRVFPKTQEEIDYYISLGYRIGWKLK